MAGSVEYLVPSSSYVNIGMERCKNHDHSLSPAIGSTDWNSSDHLGHYYITVDGVRPCRILDVSPAPSSSCGNSYYYYYYYYVTRTGTAALVPREWPDLEVRDDNATTSLLLFSNNKYHRVPKNNRNEDMCPPPRSQNMTI